LRYFSIFPLVTLQPFDRYDVVRAANQRNNILQQF